MKEIKDERKEPEGYQLESVGTYLTADGWCFPMIVDDDNRYRGYVQWAGSYLLDGAPDGDWIAGLSDHDRKIVEAVKAEVSKNE